MQSLKVFCENDNLISNWKRPVVLFTFMLHLCCHIYFKKIMSFHLSKIGRREEVNWAKESGKSGEGRNMQSDRGNKYEMCT